MVIFNSYVKLPEGNPLLEESTGIAGLARFFLRHHVKSQNRQAIGGSIGSDVFPKNWIMIAVACM